MLDRLLEEPGIRIEGISGTSAGQINPLRRDEVTVCAYDPSRERRVSGMASRRPRL